MREREGSKKSAASSQHVKPRAAEVEKPHSIQQKVGSASETRMSRSIRQKTVYRNEVR